MSLKYKFPLIIVALLLLIIGLGALIIDLNTVSDLDATQQHEALTIAAQSQKNIIDADALGLDALMQALRLSKALRYSLITDPAFTILAHTELYYLGQQLDPLVIKAFQEKKSRLQRQSLRIYLQPIRFSGTLLGYYVAAYQMPSIADIFSPHNSASKFRLLEYVIITALLITLLFAFFIKRIIDPIVDISKRFQQSSLSRPDEYQLLAAAGVPAPCWAVQPLLPHEKEAHQAHCATYGQVDSALTATNRIERCWECPAFNQPPVDEIEALKYFYNQLILSNQHHFHQSKLQQENLEKLVEARTQELMKVRNDFYNIIAHDLRTPLTSIIGFLSLVLNAPASGLKSKHRDYLEIAYKGSLALRDLSSDLTNISKIESGTVQLQSTTFNLTALFDDIVALFQPQAFAKQTQINLTTTTQRLITADQYKLRQAMMNVIANAIKFTENGTITITIEQTNNETIIIVQDTGSGIPKDEVPYIFDKYHQVLRHKKTTEGAGLGLFIVHNLIMLHHGTISVNSQELKGTTFTITLPHSISND